MLQFSEWLNRRQMLGTIGAAFVANMAGKTQAAEWKEYSENDIYKIVQDLSGKLTLCFKNKTKEILQLAQKDRNFAVNPTKATSDAAIQLCAGPVFRLNPPFSRYKLESAAEDYLNGPEDGAAHLPRKKKLMIYWTKAMPVIAGSLDFEGRFIRVPVDLDEKEKIVSGALIHKLGKI